MLEIWDEKLEEYAEKIVAYRIEFMQKIKEKLNFLYFFTLRFELPNLILNFTLNLISLYFSSKL